jgi:hypothetical protein
MDGLVSISMEQVSAHLFIAGTNVIVPGTILFLLSARNLAGPSQQFVPGNCCHRTTFSCKDTRERSHVAIPCRASLSLISSANAAATDEVATFLC